MRARFTQFMCAIVCLGACLGYMYIHFKVETKQTGRVKRPLTNEFPTGQLTNSEEIWKWVREKSSKDSKWEWKVPIEFYGRAVDQRGNPVEGAQANFTWNDTSRTGSSKDYTVTDSQGYFELLNVRGKGLSVRLSKYGYYVSRSNRTEFEYAIPDSPFYHQPDFKNPVLFRLWKEGALEQLSVTRRTHDLPTNGTPVEINLKEHRTVAAGLGDLKVEIWMDGGNRDDHNRFDWRCRFSVPGGGLVASTKEFEFEAPAEGYVPADDIDMPRTLGREWDCLPKRAYFVKLARGRYAKLECTFIVGRKATIEIVSRVNESGSRNLEYNPDTFVNP